MKIISGGQTGVDRAALDVALKYGIDCGGWCPAGRFDEFGRIPDRYPLREMESDSKENDPFATRTLQNVMDSDGTIAIYFGKLSGGTERAVRYCIELKRPHQLIDGATNLAEAAATLIADFVRKHKIDTLNVAGPRQSEWPDGYDYALRALEIFLRSCSGGCVNRQA